MHAHTHTHVLWLSGFCLRLHGWAGTRKVKPIWILLKQMIVSGSGISLAICKSAPCPRQITMLTPHQSVFYRPDALLLPNQQRQSNEGKSILLQYEDICKVTKFIVEHRCETSPQLGHWSHRWINHWCPFVHVTWPVWLTSQPQGIILLGFWVWVKCRNHYATRPHNIQLLITLLRLLSLAPVNPDLFYLSVTSSHG